MPNRRKVHSASYDYLVVIKSSQSNDVIESVEFEILDDAMTYSDARIKEGFNASIVLSDG